MITQINWHKQDKEDVFDILKTNIEGLSEEEVQIRLKQDGFNELQEKKPDSYLFIFVRQFFNPLIYILLVAVVVMIVLSEYLDAGVVGIVLLLNALIGAFQEGKAQDTLLALKKMQPAESVALRDGREKVVPARELTVGDIVILNDGDQVPADCRILQSTNLLIDESALTGESTPVEKNSEVIKAEKIQIADMSNMVFKGTFIVRGHTRVVVVATGLKTEVGKISKELTGLDTAMPLKAKIDKLTKFIIAIVGGVIGVFFVIGVLYGYEVSEMFLVAVAVAVSVIPEGLPVVITLVLATGVWRMSKQNALVKKLQAVEALGQATLIAVDKTGTITKNELMVSHLFMAGNDYEVTGDGYNRDGEIKLNQTKLNFKKHPIILLMGRIATFCANAQTVYLEDKKVWKVTGDPTEAALLVLGEKLGFKKDDVESKEPLIAEIPFDSKLKYHATLHQTAEGDFATVVGAPEVVIEKAESIWAEGGSLALTEKAKEDLSEKVVQLSAQGLRVLAVSYNAQAGKNLNSDNLPPLTFLGLVGMQDVVRTEATSAILEAKEAGVKVVMITGDHRVTAEAIATSVGIFTAGDKVVEGWQLEETTEKDLPKLVEKATVFARVSPAHKMSIIKAFKSRGEVVAMTGDGVNDALPLVAADLGIAMGKIGTEVAKEAGDIILLDDNFSSITKAMEEGRAIYQTIKKVVLYLLSTGIGEMLAILGAVILGWPLPLLATQIIWLNFVTDGFLVVAFAAEPKEKDILQHSFSKSDSNLLDGLLLGRMFLMGSVMTLGTLFLFREYIDPNINYNILNNGELVKAWTISLTTLAVFQWFNVWNCRSENRSIFSQNPLSNLYLVGATVLVVGLHLAIVYIPFLQNIFHTTSLTLTEWLIILAVASSIVVVEEVRKLIVKYKNKMNF